MRTELLYILLTTLCFTSCEEVYTPAINKAEGQLIVDALITNDPAQNHVRLTKTTGFYDNGAGAIVSGAIVKLADVQGNLFQGTENSTGNFSFQKLPVSGQRYKLQILIGNDQYESETVVMPPLPTIAKFYAERVEKIEYQTDSNGNPVASTITGQELYLDAPITATLSNYRFVTRTILEWIYVPPNTVMPPTIFGWQSLFDNSQYNIAGQKKFSQSGKIEKQPLMLLPYNTTGIIQTGASVVGWILLLDQYGTSQGSYDFHEQLNSQFAAKGSLFDPIQTQIYGNITCTTDPSKIAFGYFDLNSYRQSRYYIYFSDPKANSSVITREITRYPEIPDNGKSTNLRPAWWE